jgi:hypothetical protein
MIVQSPADLECDKCTKCTAETFDECEKRRNADAAYREELEARR